MPDWNPKYEAIGSHSMRCSVTLAIPLENLCRHPLPEFDCIFMTFSVSEVEVERKEWFSCFIGWGSQTGPHECYPASKESFVLVHEVSRLSREGIQLETNWPSLVRSHQTYDRSVRSNLTRQCELPLGLWNEKISLSLSLPKKDYWFPKI